MPHILHVSAVASLLVLAGCTEAAPPERELSASSHAIVGGVRDNGHPAVAMLYHDAGYICSGTMIDDDVYLTAGHCLETLTANDYYILGGTDLNNDEPEWIRYASSVHRHPQLVLTDTTIDHDVGIVVLSEDAPVTPYRWLDKDPGGEIYAQGTTFTAVGYGVTGNGSGDGLKRSVDLGIEEVYSNIFVYGGSNYNTCSGDSGGPGLAEIDGYLTVIGTVSFGDVDCSSYGADMRTDDNASFIRNYADPDAGRVKVGGGEGGSLDSDQPIACAVASVEPRSPISAALLAFAAMAGVLTRRRR